MTSPFETSAKPLKSLAGKRVLIVEDEFFVAEEMARDFQTYGAEVVGPVPSLDAAREALAKGDPLDGAVLDINLLGDRVFPLVDILLRRGVACVFSTGYDQFTLPLAYRSIPLCQKPAATDDIARALFG